MANKKEKVGRKLSRGLKVSNLSDAVVNREFLGKVDSELVVGRFRNGKEAYSICVVKEIGDGGFINTFDETLQQWFAFTIDDRPKLVKLLKV
jgi:hypothetical protein